MDDYAKIYYEQGKYAKAATLLSDVVPIYRGTEEAENALWLLAMSYFNQKDYLSAGEYFVRYANNYPRGKHAMESRFNVAYGDYKDSPDARLDQEITRRAIKEIDSFVDVYPHSSFYSTYLAAAYFYMNRYNRARKMLPDVSPAMLAEICPEIISHPLLGPLVPADPWNNSEEQKL